MSNQVITFHQKGDFSKTKSFLERCLNVIHLGWLDKYGKMGVDALRSATPVDTGLAKGSWEYDITREDGVVSINWYNTDIEGGYNVAILLEYGHGTRGGTFVEGRHFIQPAIQPVFDKIAEEIWEELTK